MYYVYVLQSSSGDLYIGCTSDLRERVERHNDGNTYSTRNRSWQVVYYEAYRAKKDAILRERRLKQDGRARYQLMLRLSGSLHVLK